MRIRCQHAAVMALVTNRQFAELKWVQNMAKKQASDSLDKDYDASLLLNLPTDDALALLLQALPRIIKTQKSTGLWKTKNSRQISFTLLKALMYTNLLEEIIPQLRYDPYLQFRDSEDWYGVAVRSQILHTQWADEQAVQDRLLDETSSLQYEDGSWEHTVTATVHFLEMMTEAGLSTSVSYKKGIDYLFTCVQQEVEQQNTGQNLARHMISSGDRMAEYHSACTHKTGWLPVGACYVHLPLIQTGCALHLLNKAGYESHDLVVDACQNLVDLYERFGGWCKSNIHYGLLTEKKNI